MKYKIISLKVGKTSIILTCDKDRKLHAFYNSCLSQLRNKSASMKRFCGLVPAVLSKEHRVSASWITSIVRTETEAFFLSN